jgi:hypothetical protein
MLIFADFGDLFVSFFLSLNAELKWGVEWALTRWLRRRGAEKSGVNSGHDWSLNIVRRFLPGALVGSN